LRPSNIDRRPDAVVVLRSHLIRTSVA
jgi:hypothetical protein